MDQPKRPSEKSYSDVMNEWAAQRNFVNVDRSRLFHPPHDAGPGAKLFGYLIRIALVTVLPAGIYLVLLGLHVQSKEFNTMISTGIARTLYSSEAWPALTVALTKALQSNDGSTLLLLADEGTAKEKNYYVNDFGRLQVNAPFQSPHFHAMSSKPDWNDLELS